MNNPNQTFGESIYEGTATARSFKKAYDLALSMGEIKEANLGYRQALARVQNELAISLVCEISSKKVTISKIKSW